MSKHDEYIQAVADRLVEQIKNNEAPWQKPWKAGDLSDFPVNAQGKPYNGVNVINLMSKAIEQGYSDNRWYTFYGAKQAGAKVKKGEKATDIHYWKFTEERVKRDDNGNKILDDKGKPIKEKVKLSKPRVYFAKVFNAEQIEGLPKKPKIDLPTIENWERHARCENIMKASGVDFIHKQTNRAYYSPSHDHVVMPEAAQFESADLYYATALHELGHSTGHESRLNRDLGGGFGSQRYAKEELRAEIASMLLGQELQIGHDPSQHIAYLESWAKVIKNDPKEIFRAVKDADAISKYVLAYEAQHEKTTEDKNKTHYSNIEITNQDLAQSIKKPTSFENAIDDIVAVGNRQMTNKEITELNRFVYLQDTPDVLKMLNIPDTKITIRKSTLQKIMGEHLGVEKSNHSNLHNIEPNILKQLPTALKKPIAVFKSDKNSTDPKAYLVLTELVEKDIKNKKDKAVVAILKVRQDKKGLDIINVNSVYGRSENQIGKSISNSLLYWDKRKGQEFLKTYTLQLGSDLTSENIALTQDCKTNEHLSQYLAQKNTATNERKYIYVPFEEKDKASNLGARWDKENKSWYVPADKDIDKFRRWLEPPKQELAIPTEVEFTQFLEEQGCVVSAGHPKLDGRFHRLHIEGDSAGSKNGSYSVHTENGIPRGFFKNFKTGEEVKWVSEQRTPSASRPIVDNKVILAQKEAKQAQSYTDTAQLAKAVYAASHDVKTHGYLERKGVSANNIVRMLPNNEQLPDDIQNKIVIANDWKEAKAIRENPNNDKIVLTKGDLIVPAFKNNEISTFQTISENGFKGFLKGGEKNGSFVILGEIKQDEPFLIAEGYATAATLHEQTNIAVVTAFDANNLMPVAHAMREAYPNNRIYLAADNDHEQAAKYIKEERTGAGGILNAGVEYATKAADEINAHVLIPQFKDAETGSDWNDIYKTKGTAELKSQLREQLTQIEKKTNPLTIEVSNHLKHEILTHEGLSRSQREIVTQLVNAIDVTTKNDETKLDKLTQLHDKIPDIIANNVRLPTSDLER